MKAEAERVKTLAELEKAWTDRIRALGLPSYEGKTTLNQNAGAIEALLLATGAVKKAAAEIAKTALNLPYPWQDPKPRDFLILAGDEAIDLGLGVSIDAEIEAFRMIFDAAVPAAERVREAFAAGAAAAIPAIGAIAGLFRTETWVTAVDHTTAISNRVLATAVAGRMLGRAILPGSVIGAPAAKGPLIDGLSDLARRRDAVLAHATSLPADEGAALKAAVARFDAFFARITTADSSGRVPLAQAARLEQLFLRKPLVLRIYVEKAGGSLIQRSNIWVFFGADPVRVSGGLVASYAITDPEDGRVLAADVLDCRTSIGTLRAIQERQSESAGETAANNVSPP